ncbi:mannosyltransferase [Blastocystis sp. subtype 4]|uniref:mannosyltransferase n=1 Tax=Blastocystis sp. subtype 4 TaxID=944170 RepID=UPI0007114454|nr:mannosyltransferase [Blastocystis sp. subtype 4]KNB42474.1 mannosyltransferase [Blastocystis sp. subtype 4]|eukprot:XP_014525917.1 mannosyltransferase [Blastocystis sp. subtype 4]
MEAVRQVYNYGKNVLTNRKYFWHLFWMILVGELVLDTEIDWKAYMAHVYTAIYKSLDYTQYMGETGPAVYPAGYIYVYSLLFKITDGGENIRLAQYIFLGLYLATLAVVLILYHRSNVVPQWALLLLCLSKRVKSIYYLRLFNEAVLMLPLYLSILLFTYQKWFLGVVVMSFALSIKMNILLFFPSLLLILFEAVGVPRTLFLFFVIVLVQFLLGIPFIAENAAGYLGRAYEFGRVFTYKWTVNFKFLPYDIFVNPVFGLILLVLQVSILLLFIFRRWSQPMGGIWKVVQSDPFAPKPRNLLVRMFDWFKLRDYDVPLTTEHIMTTLFASNFIGVVCSRSMHYQYYAWYFHTLPYLLWRTEISVIAVLVLEDEKLILLAAIEIVYNIYPSTPLSSILLQVAHWTLLVCLFLRKTDQSYVDDDEEDVEEEEKEKIE